MLLFDTPALVRFHDQTIADWSPDQGPPVPRHGDDPWRAIERNHLCNMQLWHEEDNARRTDVADAEIVRCKRAIDRHNQARNDAVEALDLSLLGALGDRGDQPAARLHSETPGAMVDRLSILALKVHHMRREAVRADGGEAHMQRCTAKLQGLLQQRADLVSCLAELLDELARGRARFRLYRQHKMYNDPTLNPALYRAQASAGSAASGRRPTTNRPAA